MHTNNQIEIPLPLARTWELYTCHERIAAWAPGFISIETLHETDNAVGNVYRQRYRHQEMELEEELTLLAIDTLNGFHIIADMSGKLFRETKARFEAVNDALTRITIQNQYSGEYLPNLVQRELEDYAQYYLETFKTYTQTLGED